MGNKVLKTLLISSSLLLGSMCIANAQHIDSANYNYETSKVEIEGRDFDNYNDSYAVIIVMKNGETMETFTPGEDDANIEKQEHVKIEDGKFSYSFSLSEPVLTSGKAKYTAYVKAGSLDIAESTFTYSSNAESIYTSIMNNTSATIFSRAVVNNIDVLSLESNVFGQLETTGRYAVANKVYAYKSSISSIEELKEALTREAYIRALTESKIDLVVADGNFRDAEVLGLTELSDTAYELFVSETTATGKSKVLTNIQGKVYANADEFLSTFVYEATIAAIKYNTEKGTGHIERILKGNTSIGFDFSNYDNVDTTDINLQLLNGSEWDKDDIQAVLDTEVISTDKDPANTGSGGGGTTSTGISTGGYSQNYSIGGLSTETTTPEATSPFTDLGEVEWAREYIEGLAEAGVVSGKGDGLYAPLDSVTRAEFLRMLVVALGIDVENTTCEFLDVEAGAWYYDAIATGTTFGIASGYGNGYFGTTDLITRQDAAVMLNNAVTKSGAELIELNDGIDFADKAEISDYAADDVEILVKAGILNGADGSFMPKNNCTRAEAAVMISQIMSVLGLEG